jgi:hypothetical protein
MERRAPRRPARLGALVATVSALAVLLCVGQASGAPRIVLVDESFVCTGPVDLDLVKVTMRTYRGGDGGPGVDAIVLDPGCTGRIGQIEVDTWLGDGVKVRVGPGAAHDLSIGGGYVRCHAVQGSIHQDGVQAGAGERITFRKVAIDCLGNSNFYTTGWGGGHADSIVCEGCALGPNSASTLYTNARSERSGARDSVVCQGRHPQFTFRLASPTSINLGNQQALGSDARCLWSGLLSYVGYAPLADEEVETPVLDTQLDAELVRTAIGRTRGGLRVVRATVDLGEPATVTLRLLRGDTRLARRRVVVDAAGVRTLWLRVANRYGAGRATLRVVVTDGAGNVRVLRRSVRLPAA